MVGNAQSMSATKWEYVTSKALYHGVHIIIMAELEEQHTIIPTAAAIIGIDIFVF